MTSVSPRSEKRQHLLNGIRDILRNAELISGYSPEAAKQCAAHRDRVEAALSETRTELTRVDHKALGLLTIAGVALTILVAVVAGKDSPDSIRVAAAAAAVLMAAACVRLTAAVKPNLIGDFGFIGWSPTGSGVDLIAELDTDAYTELLARAEELRAISSSVRAKYMAVRDGVRWLLTGFVLLAVIALTQAGMALAR